MGGGLITLIRRGLVAIAAGIAVAEQLHGIALSYVNILEADAAWSAACDFREPTVSIIKHATPGGLASNADILQAWEGAFMGDPMSAFGGIVGINQPVTRELARTIRASKHPTSGQRLLLRCDGSVERLRSQPLLEQRSILGTRDGCEECAQRSRTVTALIHRHE